MRPHQSLFEITDAGPLSDQEASFLCLAAEGYQPATACRKLGIDLHQQRFFIEELKAKMGARTLLALIARAFAFNVLRPKALSVFILCLLSCAALFQDNAMRRPPKISAHAARRLEAIS